MNSVIELITPNMARAYLERNTQNRALRDTVVKNYAEIIKAGDWLLTHQGIAFDVSGRLLDGQHRLSAIVMSGIAVEMSVARGLPAEAFKTLDRGLARTLSDLTKLNPRDCETFRLAWRLSGGHGKPSAQAIIDIHSVLGALATEQHRIAPTKAAFFSCSPMRLAAIVSHAQENDGGYAFNLYSRLVHGEISDLPILGETLIRRQLKASKRREAMMEGQRAIFLMGMQVFDASNKRKNFSLEESEAGKYIPKLEKLLAG